jgi:hypothetical protein
MMQQIQFGIRRAGPAGVCAVAMLLLVPATGSATKFGADLRNNDSSVVQPANAGHTCAEASDGDTNGPCTRMPYEFNSSLPNKAPRDGKLKKLKLVALDPGTFQLYLGRAKNLSGGGKGKLTRKGPKIQYQGDQGGTPGYDIESFSLGGLKVKKGDRIAIEANGFSAETCNSGGDRALLFDPPLDLGDPFATADARDDSCTYLLQLIYK